MATRIETTRNLVSDSAVQFVRPITIRLTLTAARPNTRMFVFFDNVNLTQLAYHPGNAVGSVVATDSAGQAVIDVNIPGGRFSPGDKEIVVTDTNDLANLSTTGSVFGFAKTNFASNGRVQVFEEVQTRITTVTTQTTVIYDPLAQSFFTYGNRGGVFVSSIDVFFQTKDDSIPVRVDIRPLINGLPSDPWNIIKTNGIEAVSVKAPVDVNISANGSVATKFEFSPPVYLEEDKDYCFVVFSTSPDYNIFTSRMGERSFENGRTIFEQPFIGSLFKSENNITWEPSQFEDIKFRINRARFDTTSQGELKFSVDVPGVAVNLDQFSTFSGTRVVQYRHNQEHGLELGNRIGVYLNPQGTYNGIPGTALNGSYEVTAIVDRNTIQFAAGGTTNATSTAAITSANIVTSVQVDSGGTGYEASTTISVGGPGTGAVVQPIIEGGVIIAVNVINGGTGYTSAPSLTINSTTGSGAQIVALVDQPGAVRVNKPFQGFIPSVNMRNYADSKTESAIEAVIKNFEGGNLTSYTSGGSFAFDEGVEDWVELNRNLMIASRENEVELLSNQDSAVVTTRLISSSDAVSPLLDLRSTAKLLVYSKSINSQVGEDLNSNNPSGSVSSLIVTAPGSSYTIAPVVNITAPNIPGGTQATATATISGGVVTAVNITNAGSGYTRTPIVTVSRAPGDTTGVGAAVQASLTAFNSELLPSGGNARAKYITKRTVLSTISSGVRILAEIASIPGASVDFYIRTSLSATSVEHETLNWRKLSCDVSRDRSSSTTQFLDYEFRLDNIPEFDTYDLKCVMLADDPTLAPVIRSYRVIVIA